MKKILFIMIIAAVALMFTACPKSGEPEPKEKVKLSFYVMSKCPYGAQVITGVKPALDKLGKSVDFELNYIGNKGGDGKLSSMHGDQEVQGDKISLCAKKYSPAKYMDLVACMAKDFRKIPDNFESCGKETAVDVAKIKTCVDGDEGTKLLEKSFDDSKAKGASGSPTIYLADSPYRGGRGANDFLREVCGQFKTTKPAACLSIPEPTKIKLTMVTDKRCTQCQAERLAQNLKGIFPGLDPEILDYADPKGKAEYDKFAAQGHKLLPLAIFDADVKKDDGYAKISRFVVEAGDKVVLRIGGKFDPTKEICDNKIDDTGNGKIDCEDEDCKEEMVCRKEIKNKVDLFVMSQCPYGVMALDSMKEILGAFKGDKLDFKVNYIATETEPGKFNSLHGQAEVDEDMRELCVTKHYPKNYMDYIWCRNKNIRDTSWKSCATGPVKADVVEKCATGDEGKKLLSENIKTGDALGIGGSPTWIINNNQKASGIAAADIQKNICKYNPDLKGCKATIAAPQKPAPKGGCGK